MKTAQLIPLYRAVSPLRLSRFTQFLTQNSTLLSTQMKGTRHISAQKVADDDRPRNVGERERGKEREQKKEGKKIPH